MLHLIGAPFSFGQPHRGVEKAPWALRNAGLTQVLLSCGLHLTDRGDIPVGRDSAFMSLARLSHLVEDVLRSRERCLVVGGDHSLSMGSIAGALNADPELGVLWIDAHGDMNTPETSPSGRLHGMPLAGLMGEFGGIAQEALVWVRNRLKPENLVLFGVRDLDPGELALIDRLGLTVFTMRRIHELGNERAVDEAIKALARARGGLHLSFDIDALDPFFAPGTGTPVPGGLTPKLASQLVRAAAATGRVRSMDLVEVNPDLADGPAARARTLRMSVGLARDAFRSYSDAGAPQCEDASSISR